LYVAKEEGRNRVVFRDWEISNCRGYTPAVRELRTRVMTGCLGPARPIGPMSASR